MGMYKYLKEYYKKKKTKDFKLNQREKLISWRKENTITKIERPTNLVRARELGYKPKQGYVLARIRIKRGGRKKPTIKKGRRSKRMGHRQVIAKSYQWIAEERVSKNFPNLEVLNSYNIGKDGKHYFYEIILVDPHHSVIKNDPKIKWICNTGRGRTHRGLTSTGKRSRGILTHKGKGAEKLRPSLRAKKRLSK